MGAWHDELHSKPCLNLSICLRGVQEETADRKNAVESYVYKLRNGLSGPLEAFVRPQEKEALLAKLQVCGVAS